MLHREILPEREEISEGVLLGIETLKRYGIRDEVASELSQGKVYCSDSGELVQHGANIDSEYLSSPATPPRPLTELEQQILLDIPDLFQFDTQLNEWINPNKYFSVNFPMYCINSKLAQSNQLSVISYGGTWDLASLDLLMDGKTLELPVIVADVDKYKLSKYNRNIKDWYWRDHILVLLDRERIVRIV